MNYYTLRKAFADAKKPQFSINCPVRYLGYEKNDSNTFRIGRVVAYTDGVYTIRFHDGVEIEAYSLELMNAIDPCCFRPPKVIFTTAWNAGYNWVRREKLEE